MKQLFGVIYAIAGSTLAGSAVVAALVLGHDTLAPIVIAAAIGAGLGVPVSWLVARQISGA